MCYNSIGVREFFGRSSGFKFRKQHKKEGDNPYGIVQSKTFGSPTVSGNLGSTSGAVGKSIIKNSILDLGVASGVAIGASADSAIGFSDGGVLTGLGADIGKRIPTDMANRVTEDTNTTPDRTRYFGDPISMFDFQAKTIMPSLNKDGEIVFIHTRGYR